MMLWSTSAPLRQPTTAVAALVVLTSAWMPSGASAQTPRCTGAQPPLVTDLAVHQTPDIPEPAARTPYRDTVFGTCQMRVTDRLQDLPVTGEGLKNEYSRVQAFNADESRVLVRGTDANWYLYDVATLQFLRQLPLETDPRWDASDPDLVYHSDGTVLMQYDIIAEEQSVVRDFASDLPQHSLTAVWTRYEGSPSYDGRYWGLMAQNLEWETVALLVYDQLQDEVVATRDLPGNPSIDAVTISPLGTYFLAYFDDYCAHGQLGDDANPCGLMVYDRELTTGRGLLRIAGHSDAAVDAQGREVLVYQDIDTDHIAMLDLGSGTVTPLWPIDFSHTGIGFHFSGRASRRPGWALVSTYNGGHPTDFTWMDDQVFAVELAAGGQVVRLAHTHSLFDEDQPHDYWAEPQASVNRDFTRVVFASNWGRTGTDQVEMHMVELPADWSGEPPACSLNCSATAPATGSVGLPVDFDATAVATGCTGQPTFDWAFGDGSSHSAEQSPSHTYASAGTYGWTMASSVDGITCSDSGTLVIADEPTQAHAWLIPAVVHSPGAQGSQWRTTLTAVNRSDSAAIVTLTFYPSGGGASRDVQQTLPAGGTRQWPDVLVSELDYGAGDSIQGTMHVSSPEEIITTSRTYNQTATGTFGQYIPAVPIDGALTADEAGVLPNLVRSDAFRTNVGVLNLGSEPVSVMVSVFGPDGSPIGNAVNRTVQGGHYWQGNDFLGPDHANAGDQAIAYATVEVETGGRVWAYASVVDNGTGDPTTIPLLE